MRNRSKRREKLAQDLSLCNGIIHADFQRPTTISDCVGDAVLARYISAPTLTSPDYGGVLRFSRSGGRRLTSDEASWIWAVLMPTGWARGANTAVNALGSTADCCRDYWAPYC